jgi:hypothetical protein
MPVILSLRFFAFFIRLAKEGLPGKEIVSPILSDSRGFTPHGPAICAGTELAMAG